LRHIVRCLRRISDHRTHASQPLRALGDDALLLGNLCVQVGQLLAILAGRLVSTGHL
jgi:hypothetical protein